MEPTVGVADATRTDAMPVASPATLAIRADSPARRRPLWLSRRRRRDFWIFLLFVGPNLALIIAFCWRPVIQNIQYSFLDWTLGNKKAFFVGLGNYIEFFTGEGGKVLLTTLIFTVTTVGGAMVIGLLLALVLNRGIKGTTFARSAVFAPFVLSYVGVGLVWMFIFDPTFGILSIILKHLGAAVPQWFTDPSLSLAMICIVFVWKNLGYCAVIYLAGLQSIPADVLEAAAIDGAGKWRRFWRISFPLLSPTTFFLLITTMLSSLQAFDLIRIMTPLSPGTLTLMYDVYVQAFGGYNRAGYSSALATILFVILMVVTLLQMRFIERRVHYA